MQIHQFPTMGAPSTGDFYPISHDNTVYKVDHRTIVEAAGEQAKNLIRDAHGTFTGNIDQIRDNSMYWVNSSVATGTFPTGTDISGTSWQIETHSIYDTIDSLLQLAWYRSGKPYLFVRRYTVPSGQETGTWTDWLRYADDDRLQTSLTSITSRLTALERTYAPYTKTLANGLTVDAWRRGDLCQLYVHGTLATELGTSSGYVDIDTLTADFRPRTHSSNSAIVNYTWIGNALFGQFNVSPAGLIRIGYTRKINATGNTRKTTETQNAPALGDAVDIIASTNLLKDTPIYASQTYIANN